MRFVLKYFKMALGRESDISNKINPNSLQLIYRSQDGTLKIIQIIVSCKAVYVMLFTQWDFILINRNY